MNNEIHIHDKSEDKKYFTLIPNIVGEDSSANAIAIYFLMKKMAGDRGYCYASNGTFKLHLKIGYKALQKAIKTCLTRDWIRSGGTKSTWTGGGTQFVNVYYLNDIWKRNAEYFEKQSFQENSSSKVGLKGAQGRSERNTTKITTNIRGKVGLKETPLTEEEIIFTEEEKKRREKITKKEEEETRALLERYKPEWMKNKIEY